MCPCYSVATSKYLPAQSILAEAVPGIEEDYPCAVRVPVIRKILKGSRGVWAWWEAYLRKTVQLQLLMQWLWLPTSLVEKINTI